MSAAPLPRHTPGAWFIDTDERERTITAWLGTPDDGYPTEFATIYRGFGSAPMLRIWTELTPELTADMLSDAVGALIAAFRSTTTQEVSK